MATTVDNFNVRFGADFKELLAEMRKAEQAAPKFRSTMQKELGAAHAAVERIAGQMKGALLGIVGVFSAAKITGMARETLRWADDTKTLADRLGTSAESIQELIFAGREMNITSQEMTKGLSEFAVKVAEAASGKGRGVVAFQALGLSVRDVEGRVKTLDAQLDDFADKIRQFDRPSQLALAKSFFGDEGALKFLDLLGQGKGKMDELRTAARNAGVVLSNEVVAKGEALNKEVERLTDKVNTGLRQAFLDLGPVIEGSLKVLLSIFRDTKEFIAYLEGKSGAMKGRWAIQPGPGPKDSEGRTIRGMPTTQVRITDERMEGAALHDETRGSRADQARREPGGIPGTRGVDLSGKGATQAETFRKLMEDLRTDTAKATAALDPFKAAIADLDGKLAKMTASTTQNKLAKAEFNKAWDAKGAKALAEFSAESEHITKVAAAEAMGRRDLVAVLELEFALRQKFGDKFVADNKLHIEQMAKLRFEIDEHRKKIQDLSTGIAGHLESGAAQMTEAFASFFDKSKNGWQEMGNVAINTLKAIAQEILVIMALRPLAQAGAGALSGFLGSLFGGGAVGAHEAAQASGGIGSILASTIGLAEGGNPPMNRWSLVGERGPELIMPRAPMTVVPNHAMGGGTAVLYGRPDSTVRLAEVEGQLKRLGFRVQMIDSSIEGRAVAATSDAERRTG